MFRLDIWYCHLATTGIIDYLITDYTQQPMPAQHDRQQGDFCSLRYQFAGLASCFSTDQNKLKSLEDVLQKPDEGNLHVRFCEGDHSNSGLLPPNKRCAMGSTRHPMLSGCHTLLESIRCEHFTSAQQRSRHLRRLTRAKDPHAALHVLPSPPRPAHTETFSQNRGGWQSRPQPRSNCLS